MFSKHRLQDLLGMVLMGDAVLHVLHERNHIDLWKQPEAPGSRYNRAWAYVTQHPVLFGLYSAGEFALGVALARRAERAAAGG